MGSRPIKWSAQHEEEYKALCALLKQWREDAGLTQRDMAKKLGRAHSIIAKIETGDRKLDPIEFLRWCEATSIEPSNGMKQLNSIVKASV